MKQQFNFKEIVFISSELCNLNCKYCYIANTKNDPESFYFQEHNRITESFKDCSYIDNFVKGFKRLEYDTNNITQFALWGQEPTMNMEYFFDNFHYLYQNFSNLQYGMFSTNGVHNIEKIYNAILQMDKVVKPPFQFSLQFSIDGSKYTKENRGIDSSVIINNIKTLINKLNNTTLNNMEVIMYFHNVLGRNLVEELQTQEEIDEFWKEINNFATELHNLSTNQKVTFSEGCGPAVEQPVAATKQDGLNLANFLYKSLQGEGFENVKLLLDRVYDRYYFHSVSGLTLEDLFKIVKDLDRFDSKAIETYHNLSRGCCCGSQTASLKMMYDGRLYLCQNLMFKQREEDFDPNEKSDIHFKTLLEHGIPNLLTSSDDELAAYFKDYKVQAESGFGIKLTNSLNLMYWLAECNLIDPAYKLNQEKMLRHAFLFAWIQHCPHANIYETGSPYGRSLELAKFYFNGAMDIYEDYVIRNPYWRGEKQ